MNNSGFITVSLEDVRLYARHGVFDHERRDGNEFLVNLHVIYPASYFGSPEGDDLDHTLSYVTLYNIVKEEMSQPKNLLETVAVKIVERITLDFTWVVSVDCKISKIHPPISSFQGEASVAYKWQKEV